MYLSEGKESLAGSLQSHVPSPCIVQWSKWCNGVSVVPRIEANQGIEAELSDTQVGLVIVPNPQLNITEATNEYLIGSPLFHLDCFYTLIFITYSDNG